MFGTHGDLFMYALNNLRHRQLRSWLTIIGIIIGVAAIVSLIAISQGLDSEIRKQLNMFGDDLLTITPKTAGGGGLASGGGSFGVSARTGVLTQNDADGLKKIGGVRRVTTYIGEQMSFETGGKNATIMIMGAEPQLADMYNIRVEEGRLPQEGDTGTTVLGYNVANSMFDKKIEVGKRVRINDRDFRVVGIFEKSGSGVLSFIDSLVYIPEQDARDLSGLYKGNRMVASIMLQMEPGADPKAVEEDVTNEMYRMHKVTPDTADFTVVSAEYVRQQVGAITGLLTLFLGGIAGISLVVGGVGIANTMFMSVLERTREIGTLKAIGASDNAILEVFIFESALIGFIGGFIGLAIGAAFSLVLNLFGFNSVVTPELVIFAVMFSVVIGVVSGILPARRAARLQPMEALRYE